jgi:hypothetical protein
MSLHMNKGGFNIEQQESVDFGLDHIPIMSHGFSACEICSCKKGPNAMGDSSGESNKKEDQSK